MEITPPSFLELLAQYTFCIESKCICPFSAQKTQQVLKHRFLKHSELHMLKGNPLVLKDTFEKKAEWRRMRQLFRSLC